MGFLLEVSLREQMKRGQRTKVYLVLLRMLHNLASDLCMAPHLWYIDLLETNQALTGH